MFYDYDFYLNGPTYYSRPLYYTSYWPSYYVGDRYYNTYRHYTPLYQYPRVYTTRRTYISYRPNYDYDIPEYSYRPLNTIVQLSKTSPPAYPEAQKYALTYGLDFDSTAKDVRTKIPKLLKECHEYVPRSRSIPRFGRGSSCEPLYNSDIEYYRNKRALSTRMMSEAPRSRSITCY